MTSSTRLPTGTPVRPWLKPASTLPPSWNPNTCPACDEVGQLLANTEPVRQSAPTNWATTVSPLVSFGPEPLIRVVTDRLAGGEVLGTVMTGAWPVLAVTVGSVPPPLDTCGPDADCVLEYCCSRSTTMTRVSVLFTPSCD